MRYNLPIEMLYTVVPFIMVGILFFFTARDENSIDSLSAHPNVIVNVTGYQWSWQFQYPGYQVPGSPHRRRDDERRAVEPADTATASCRCW